jgi:hypothetical protein
VLGFLTFFVALATGISWTGTSLGVTIALSTLIFTVIAVDRTQSEPP